MKIIHYPHPTLRYKSKPIRRIDGEFREIVKSMFGLMYEAKGIGLAANQVDLPLRFFICNLAAAPGEGEEVVFLNPVVSRPKGNEEREEGCLSIPGVYAPVRRPESVHLEAFSLDGDAISLELDGLLARVVQHEVDHLDGVLFIDRLSETVEMDTQPQLEEFTLDYQSRLDVGSADDADAIAEKRVKWEQKYAIS